MWNDINKEKKHRTELNYNQNCVSLDLLIIYNLRRQKDAMNRFKDVGFESHHKHPHTAAASEK